MSEPAWTADVSLGTWVGPRLAAWGQGRGTPVTAVVPGGYEAYARVLHPVSDSGPEDQRDDEQDGGPTPTTWAQVCASVGTTPHPLMQWQAITRARRTRRSTTRQWQGGDPEQGNLEDPSLAAVLEVLARWTPTAQDCVMAVWEGHGWVDGHGAALFGPSGTVALPPAYPPHVLAGPRLSLPGREYLLFTGALGSATLLGRRTPGDLLEAGMGQWLWRQSPNLLWPLNRSWCVATEVDLDSTLVGGPAALVEALNADPRVEAYVVPAEGDLSCAGDRVNVG